MSCLLTLIKIQQGQVLSLKLLGGGLEPAQLFFYVPLGGYNIFPAITKGYQSQIVLESKTG